LFVALSSPGANIAPVAFADSTCVAGWQTNEFGDKLEGLDAQGVATLNGQPSWIVGLSSAQSESKRVPLIGQWTGTSWAFSAAPWKSFGVLNAVSSTSPTNAWVVGSVGSYTRWPIAAHWDGAKWTTVAVPKPSGQLGVFTDMATVDTNRFWASGARLKNGLLKPIVSFHNLKGWHSRNPSIPSGAEGGLSDVTIAPGGRVWAGGWLTDTTGQGRPWVIYWTSKGWKTSLLAHADAGRASVMDLTFTSATNGYAVGFIERDGGGYEPLIQHWNGVSWSAVDTSWAAGRSIALAAVSVDSSGRLVVAGAEIGQQRRDIVAVHDSAGWHISSLSTGSANTDRGNLTDTAPITNGTIVVGYSDGDPASLMSCTTSPGAAPESVTVPNVDQQTGDEDDDAAVPGQDPPDNLNLATQTVPNTQAVDMTAAAGLTLTAPTWGGVVADFNNDGHPDVFINRHYEDYPLMMVNSALGVFSQLSATWRLSDRHNCAAADVNLDGVEDLFCSIGVNKGTSNTPDELTLSPINGGGTWSSLAYGVMDGFGRGRNATFLNLNGDAYPDLYIVNEASRSDAMLSSDRLYVNDNGTRFLSASSWGVDHSMGGSCVTSADLDGNGFDDLLLCTEEPVGGQPAGAHVFMNDGTKFTDKTTQLGLASAGATDIETADFNGDGKLDVAELGSKLLTVKLNGGATFTQAYSLPLTAAVDMAVGDVNGDGRPDIYVSRRTKGNTGNLMLVNNGDGTAFTSMDIPQAGAGSADEVMPIDFDGNGRTDFITLNGWNVPGPVKLTAFYPSNP
jgi:hypothetical protein